MKSNLLLVTILLLSHSATEAKTFEGAGAVLGVGFSRLGGVDSYAASRRAAVQGGVMADFFSSYLRMELHYLERGQYYLTDIVNEHGDFIGQTRDDMWTNYLTLPVMARFIADTRPVKLLVTAGPRLDVLLGYWQSTMIYPLLRRSYFSPVNIGMNWGGGIMIPLGSGTVIPEVRVAHTFNNAYRARSTSLYPTALEFIVAYRF